MPISTIDVKNDPLRRRLASTVGLAATFAMMTGCGATKTGTSAATALRAQTVSAVAPSAAPARSSRSHVGNEPKSRASAVALLRTSPAGRAAKQLANDAERIAERYASKRNGSYSGMNLSSFRRVHLSARLLAVLVTADGRTSSLTTGELNGDIFTITRRRTDA